MLVITNTTTGDAVDVSMVLQGGAVGGVLGQHDWSYATPLLRRGESVEVPMRRTAAADVDPPNVSLGWTEADTGERCEEVLRLPLLPR